MNDNYIELVIGDLQDLYGPPGTDPAADQAAAELRDPAQMEQWELAQARALRQAYTILLRRIRESRTCLV